MPELPEVETIRRDLEKQVLNKEIIGTRINLSRSLENPLGYDIKGIIYNISRFGKYLIIEIMENSSRSNNTCEKKQLSLVIHLRMTGKLIYNKISNGFDEKHVRVVFLFNGGDCLIFSDIRTFGKIEVFPFQIQLEKFKKIGIDALSEKFTLKFLNEACQSKKVPIKNFLLDQAFIAGIGNIYAQEILFEARVSPIRLTNTLNKKEIKQIYKYIKEILLLAITHNGTSISDFRRVDDKTGEFQNFLKVYGKSICCVCKNSLIKIKQSGRTTTYCGICQK